LIHLTVNSTGNSRKVTAAFLAFARSAEYELPTEGQFEVAELRRMANSVLPLGVAFGIAAWSRSIDVHKPRLCVPAHRGGEAAAVK
jgi:glycine/serine hydroxymethyltransferase